MDYNYNVYLRRLVIKMLNYDNNKRPSASDSLDELEIVELFVKSPNNKIIRKILRELKLNDNKKNDNNQNFQNAQNYPMNYQGYTNNMNNQFMFQNNYVNMNQINTNMNSTTDKEYEDIYPEIKEKKIKVNFIFDNEYYYVQIPSSLRKDELYSSVKYICPIIPYYGNIEMIEMIELFHNGIELENDDSKINGIKDFDSIIVKLNNSEKELYKCEESLHLKTKFSKKLFNIFLEASDGNKLVLNLEENMTIEEMMKVFCINNNIKWPHIQKHIILYCRRALQYNKTLFECHIHEGAILQIFFSNYYDSYTKSHNPGKMLNVSVKEEIGNLEFNYTTGTLQKIKDFYNLELF